MLPPSPNPRSLARGYTAVEILVAITLFGVGTAGVLSLQRAAIIGSADARKVDVATAVAGEWIERLRKDSFAWTLPNASNPTSPSNHNTATRYLAVVVDGPTGTSDAGADTDWITPTIATTVTGAEEGTAAYDLLGRPMASSDSEYLNQEAPFCVQYRLHWLSYDPGGIGQMMRAEVRVFWAAQSSRVPCIAGTGNPASLEGRGAFPDGYKTVQLTTTLRGNL